MNYPVWDIPASGLLIAVIAILHVFVSHFAVGGGLYLVLVERKARRTGDAPLLDYARRLSRFFILLTLVFGAITGVGIWFTIGLVVASVPVSLILMFFIARKTVAKIRERNADDPNEEAGIGKDS